MRKAYLDGEHASVFFFTAKKKNKKGKTLSLTNFLAEDGGSGGGGGGAPTYIPKPVSWADETDDLEGDGKEEINSPNLA